MTTQPRASLVRAFAVAFATAALSVGLEAQRTTGTLPLKYSGPPTTAPITAGDLMTRLYIFADDSMGGRAMGTVDNLRGTAYIEAELRRLGLQPAGDNGGYFQDLPLRARILDTMSTLTTDGKSFRGGSDFVASTVGVPRQLRDVQVIFGGTAIDTANLLPVDAVRGKIVLLRPFALTAGMNVQALLQSNGYRAYLAAMSAAAGSATVVGENLSPAQLQTALRSTSVAMGSSNETPLSIAVTTRVAEAMMGSALADMPKGTVGRSITTDVKFIDTPQRLGRNVVAIFPGSDPKLRGQYVAVGAHNDHVRPSPRAVEHDSMKVFNTVGRPGGADGGRTTPVTPEEWVAINAGIDSLRRIYPARMDSINNGADDDGSGSVAALELAEAFAKGSVKPKRSVLFIWHSGEESGMLGSGHFMDSPTVPRDSIVAQLNMDMIGRGAPTDVTGENKDGGVLRGAERYVQLVGSKRLSTELGNLVETVNKDARHNFLLDYGIDADGHPQRIYCRSDHWSYAKWGVPVVFFTTGGHADYHQVTDEPQYIRYDHMAALSRMIFDVTLRVANLDHRVIVDKPKPDPLPGTTCRQ